MTKKITIKQIDIAFKKSPKLISRELNNYIIRSLAEYKRIAVGSPWKIGQSGGGIPVDTGNLKERHRTTINKFVGKFGVPANSVPYAYAVYFGEKGRQGRPWLAYAQSQAEPTVKKLYDKMGDNIIKNIV